MQREYFRSFDSSVTQPTGNELAKATFPSGGRVPNKPNNTVYLNNVRPEIQAVPVRDFVPRTSMKTRDGLKLLSSMVNSHHGMKYLQGRRESNESGVL